MAVEAAPIPVLLGVHTIPVNFVLYPVVPLGAHANVEEDLFIPTPIPTPPSYFVEVITAIAFAFCSSVIPHCISSAFIFVPSENNISPTLKLSSSDNTVTVVRRQRGGCGAFRLADYEVCSLCQRSTLVWQAVLGCYGGGGFGVCAVPGNEGMGGERNYGVVRRGPDVFKGHVPALLYDTFARNSTAGAV